MNTRLPTRTLPRAEPACPRAELCHHHLAVVAPASTIGTRVFAKAPNRARLPNPAEDNIPMRTNRAVCIARARLCRIDLPDVNSSTLTSRPARRVARSRKESPLCLPTPHRPRPTPPIYPRNHHHPSCVSAASPTAPRPQGPTTKVEEAPAELRPTVRPASQP
jgi:hypothetical protein